MRDGLPYAALGPNGSLRGVHEDKVRKQPKHVSGPVTSKPLSVDVRVTEQLLARDVSIYHCTAVLYYIAHDGLLNGWGSQIHEVDFSHMARIEAPWKAEHGGKGRCF